MSVITFNQFSIIYVIYVFTTNNQEMYNLFPNFLLWKRDKCPLY